MDILMQLQRRDTTHFSQNLNFTCQDMLGDGNLAERVGRLLDFLPRASAGKRDRLLDIAVAWLEECIALDSPASAFSENTRQGFPHLRHEEWLKGGLLQGEVQEGNVSDGAYGHA